MWLDYDRELWHQGHLSLHSIVSLTLDWYVQYRESGTIGHDGQLKTSIRCLSIAHKEQELSALVRTLALKTWPNESPGWGMLSYFSIAHIDCVTE